MQRNRLFSDPSGIFLHQAVLQACVRSGEKIAVIDTSSSPKISISYAKYGELVASCARGFIRAGIRPGDIVAIFLTNCWEFPITYHAATLAGAVPTLLNPSYREREVRYQLENSGAVALISDGLLLQPLRLEGIPSLRQIYFTRQSCPGAEPFAGLLRSSSVAFPEPASAPEDTLAALPYSSGTTGLPKGVMLTHLNLVANVNQYLAPGEIGTPTQEEVILCFLPLYHIYGLNVILNPTLLGGGTLVLMPRFDVERALKLLTEESITYLPLVPPVVNAISAAAERGWFPSSHRVRGSKSGAAPLAPELARRFTELTGIPLRQGYGMTEASPVTHLGFFEPQWYRPETIGKAVALTECRIVSENGTEVRDGEPGELVMRGPQFMKGYWNSPSATSEVLQEGWYWSGDIAVRDGDSFYRIVDRRKELIKFKGFPIAPAEVEAVLLEHPVVQDCGIVGVPDAEAGEVPCAFVVLRDQTQDENELYSELKEFVAERLTSYKQPQHFRRVSSIPRNPSGKILRKDLRTLL